MLTLRNHQSITQPHKHKHIEDGRSNKTKRKKVEKKTDKADFQKFVTSICFSHDKVPKKESSKKNKQAKSSQFENDSICSRNQEVRIQSRPLGIVCQSRRIRLTPSRQK